MVKEFEKIINTKVPAKRYFARISGSRFICPHCSAEYTFFHGKIDIDTKECQDELDHIVMVGNPNIYTQDVIPNEVKAVEKDITDAQNTAKSEADIRAQDHVLSGVRHKVQQEVGAISVNAGMPTDPNQSTADPALQRTFAAAPKPGTIAASGAVVVKKA